MVSSKRKTFSDGENIGPSKKYKPAKSPPQSLVLRDEEAFPRGGASVLTSLEQKQIRIQATEDALFEQATGTKSARNDFGDEENEEDPQDGKFEAAPKTRREQLSKVKSGISNGSHQESGVRIEGLSYKVCFTEPQHYLANRQMFSALFLDHWSLDKSIKLIAMILRWLYQIILPVISH